MPQNILVDIRVHQWFKGRDMTEKNHFQFALLNLMSLMLKTELYPYEIFLT